MAPPSEENLQRKLEDWLRYYQDIGMGLFYRARALRAAEPTPAAPSQTRVPRTRQFTPVQAAVLSAAKISVLPVAQGPSLFEAAERIEGDSLARIRADLGDCTRCKLCRGRRNIVFGDGSEKADLVFVGEGPGHDEDVQGLPFVGRAGKLLTQMIEAMGLDRRDVYICNVVKCRPPENRTPERDEIATCSPFLLRQLEAIRPKVIVCLGSVAAQTLLGTNRSISHYRGEWLDFRGAKLMATYHPAYLLRNPGAKGDVWKDLQKVMAVLGLSGKKRRL
jgi:uracil-DNA glycosylase family 4